jgi:hypothetical protein
MHIFLDLSNLLLVVLLVSALVLRLLPSFSEWSQRQALQTLVMLLPLVSLVVLVGGLVHVTNVKCIVRVPIRDHWLDILLLLTISLPLRCVPLPHHLKQYPTPLTV